MRAHYPRPRLLRREPSEERRERVRMSHTDHEQALPAELAQESALRTRLPGGTLESVGHAPGRYQPPIPSLVLISLRPRRAETPRVIDEAPLRNYLLKVRADDFQRKLVEQDPVQVRVEHVPAQWELHGGQPNGDDGQRRLRPDRHAEFKRNGEHLVPIRIDHSDAHLMGTSVLGLGVHLNQQRGVECRGVVLGVQLSDPAAHDREFSVGGHCRVIAKGLGTSDHSEILPIQARVAGEGDPAH